MSAQSVSSPTRTAFSRRHLLKTAAFSALAMGGSMTKPWSLSSQTLAAEATEKGQPLSTRGIVVSVQDLASVDWAKLADQAGLSTIGTHMYPHEVVDFVQTDRGQAFLESCRRRKIEVEHELHSMSDLLPRALFKKDPTLFRMDEKGQRVAKFNCCVHSKNAIELICENAVKYAQLLPPTTGRYFYWIDDGAPMCRCPKCRELSDSDQALLLENEILRALRKIDPRAKLAHLAYLNTLAPPTKVKPEPGVFLEFAPIWRLYDTPLSRREAHSGNPKHPKHGETLDWLDANLECFGADDAQVLEYWLDESRFAGWNRKNLKAIPWHQEVFLDDVKTYTQRGIRHITSFGVWIDAEYFRRFGNPPLQKYNDGLRAQV